MVVHNGDGWGAYSSLLRGKMEFLNLFGCCLKLIFHYYIKVSDKLKKEKTQISVHTKIIRTKIKNKIYW